MKRFIALFVAVTLVTSVAASQLKQNADIKKADAPVLTTVIKVPTIVCGSCITTITDALKKVDGVKTAKVDLKKKTATIRYASAKVTVDKLEKVIAAAGYDANSVKRNPDAYDKLDACCKVDPKQ